MIAQPYATLCATAAWNQTFSIAAGSTSTPGITGTLLNTPYGMAFDGYQNMYVADTANHRIQLFPSGFYSNV